jgi:hypothetical protein
MGPNAMEAAVQFETEAGTIFKKLPLYPIHFATLEIERY